MGRLTKEKIDEIRRLGGEGYTKKEIAEKLGVSRSTVSKYVEERPEGEPPSSQPLLYEVIKTLFGLLMDINLLPILSKEDLARGADSEALMLTERIAEIAPDYAEKLIEENPYITYLGDYILDLSKSDDELSEDELRQRKAWIKVLKKHYPKKLAELV